MIDFGYRATHEMTLKSKQLVKEFYDRSEQFAYFKGCSTGGRMALMEAQRYPDDYDGIIAGSLANRHIHMWTAGVARSVNLHASSRGRDQRRAGRARQQPGDEQVRHAEGRVPQQPEGVQGRLRRAEVQGRRKRRCHSCLTDPQLKTVETYYGGVKNSKGELIFSGQALGNPIGAQRPSTQGPGGVYDLVKIAYNDPNVDWKTFDLDRDMKYLDEKIGYVDSVDLDMSKYKKSGGKLIITHGWADTGITPENTVWYYESVLNKMGKNQSDWMRLFMAPGMGHCGGGPGVNSFDSIGALEKWVEKGVAPDTMMGIGRRPDPPAVPVPDGRRVQRHRRSEGREELVL